MGNAVKDDKTAFASVLTDDSAKRENLKTVSDKPKMEIQKEPFKPVEQKMKVTVDVNIAPAILEAAIRDIRNPHIGSTMVDEHLEAQKEAMPLCKGQSLEMLGSRDEVKSEFSLFVDVTKKLYQETFYLFICSCVIVIVALLEAYPYWME
ncbi:hypothetical protein Bca101_001414 [Brassica carinata]